MPSPEKIKVKDHITTKKNYGTEGKIGKLVGKTDNNMFLLEIDGKEYYFFRKDLDIKPLSPKQRRSRSINPFDSPKRSSRRSRRSSPNNPFDSSKLASPSSLHAEEIADNFLSSLEPTIASRVVNILCKRRTSRVKSPRKSPSGRNSPVRRRSPKKQVCKDDEEISIKTGRCILKCNDDQVRNPVSNRCIKKHSKRSSPKQKIRPSTRKSPIIVTDDDMIFEDDLPVRKSPFRVSTPVNSPVSSFYESDTEDYPVEERVRRSSPRYIGSDESDPVTELIIEEEEDQDPYKEIDETELLLE
jgi:hypothetical protein